MNWYVILTRPKWELKTCMALLEDKIEANYPTYYEVRQWSDRKKKIIKPYCNSYVFVRLQDADLNRVFDIPGVVKSLFWQGQAAKLQEEEIHLLKKYLDGNQQETVKVEQ